MLPKFGIGIDIVDINRFRKMPFKENKMFYEKIFDKKEIDYCLQFKDPYPNFAGKFAVKEAVVKSINENESLSNIITDHFNKKPIVSITDKKKFEFLVSITHEKDYAVGVVISELIN